MTEPEAASLTGFTVAITASRRVDEFTTMLRRRGAEVVAAAAMSMVPLADDARLRAATDDVIDAPPDVLIATTGIGFRGWVEAAEGWGLAEALLAALAKARVISRGPKATGALRAAGLREEWSPVSESSEEVLAHLSADDLDGKRVAVQLHGATDDWDPVPGDVYKRQPWTLPSNQAVAVNPDVTYVQVRAGEHRVVLAEARLASYARELGEEPEVLGSYQGSDLVGIRYRPPFPYFMDSPNAFQVLQADFVTTDDGTGIVHLAPAYGEDDKATADAVGIVPVTPVDAKGRFDATVPDYQGQHVFDAKDVYKRQGYA